MTAPIWLRRTGRTLNSNSTSILSAAAVGGVIATAVLSIKAAKKIEVEVDTHGHGTRKEWLEANWKTLTPPVLSGTATIVCIIGANQIGLRRQAAILGAYTLADSAFREYKEEVVKLLGDKKDQAIHDQIATRKMEENPPPPGNEVIITGGGEQLCYDTLSGRYFRSDIETIRQAANNVNEAIIGGNMYAALNEFWAYLGLDDTTLGDEMGFNLEHLIKLTFTSHLAKDGRTALAVTHVSLPVYDYGKVF